MNLSRRFERALVFAVRLHGGQTRKETQIPYLSHLPGVAAIVMEHGGDEDQAIAALLHDAVEDQGGAKTRKRIRRRFGNAVAGIVDGCTEANTVPKPSWRERKERYLERLRGAPEAVRRVPAADKLHNARSVLADYRVLGDPFWSRFNAGEEDHLWYYRALVKEFQRAGPASLAEELNRVVSEIGRLSAGRSGGSS